MVAIDTALQPTALCHSAGTSRPIVNQNLLKRDVFRFFPDTFPSSLSRSQIKIGVLSAMCIWEMNSRIRFVRNLRDNEDRADVRIGFGRSELVCTCVALVIGSQLLC